MSILLFVDAIAAVTVSCQLQLTVNHSVSSQSSLTTQTNTNYSNILSYHSDAEQIITMKYLLHILHFL